MYFGNILFFNTFFSSFYPSHIHVYVSVLMITINDYSDIIFVLTVPAIFLDEKNSYFAAFVNKVCIDIFHTACN